MNCSECMNHEQSGKRHKCKAYPELSYIGELEDCMNPNCNRFKEQPKKAKESSLVAMRSMLQEQMRILTSTEDPEKLKIEVQKAGAMANLTNGVIDITRLQMDAMKMAYDYGEDNLPLLLGGR